MATAPKLDVESPPVPVEVSDLFFNLDLEHAKTFDRVQNRKLFAGWNEEILRTEAQFVLDCLAGLHVPNLPTAEKLVEDFHGRE